MLYHGEVFYYFGEEDYLLMTLWSRSETIVANKPLWIKLMERPSWYLEFAILVCIEYGHYLIFLLNVKNHF